MFSVRFISYMNDNSIIEVENEGTNGTMIPLEVRVFYTVLVSNQSLDTRYVKTSQVIKFINLI